MADSFLIPVDAPRTEKYRLLAEQFEALRDQMAGPIANMANLTAGIKEAFGFHWVGFYLVRNGELVLGPFQGPAACTRIAFGKGVCGKAWEQGSAIVVPDVELFPGHIACSSLSKSEIVLPVFKAEAVVAVLDIDSDRLDDFSSTDQDGLTALLNLLLPCL